MPSVSLETWNAARLRRLDEIAQAHAAVGGPNRGRRYATQQINYAYAVLLSSEFQGYCRDLHSESIDYLFGSLQPVALQAAIRETLLQDRKLDRGNPNPGNIGSDFKRIGLGGFWGEVNRVDRRNRDRQQRLIELCDWRNAIAHQDFRSGNTALTLAEVKRYRGAVEALAGGFDAVAGRYVEAMTGTRPW